MATSVFVTNSKRSYRWNFVNLCSAASKIYWPEPRLKKGYYRLAKFHFVLFFSVFSDYLSWKLEKYSLAHNRRTSYNIRRIVTIFINLLWPYLIMLNSYNKFQSSSVKSKTFLTIRKNSDFLQERKWIERMLFLSF